ncbi:MAG: sodium:proton antiporter, partial [Marivivens sp.]|nr:sodium:proton antiporter [Marivivens sp.]NDH02740.1 sodium:proton antiporter [Marivivens sp.]
AAIGFTVALFVASVAFDAGPVQDAAKMGALFSFFAAAISIVAGKLTGVQKVN